MSNIYMKNAILLHGYGDSPASFWLPYTKEMLENRDYEVWAPQLPGSENPNIDTQLPFVLKHGVFTAETVIIAHSGGCPLTLAILENIEVKIKQAILVAAFIEAKDKLTVVKGLIKKNYNWQKIKNNVADFIVINSDNDPWGCDVIQGMNLLNKMGGTLIIRHGEGHMGSNVYNQPYTEFPFLMKLID